MIRNRIVLFILSYIVWCLLCWVPDWQHLIAGVVISLIVTWIFGEMFLSGKGKLKGPKSYFYFMFYFLPVFILEVIKENINMALRIINPEMPIKPGIVKVKTSLKSDTAISLLAWAITLTRGALCVDADKDNGFLYVHWIDIRGKNIDEATRLVCGRFEGIIKKVME